MSAAGGGKRPPWKRENPKDSDPKQSSTHLSPAEKDKARKRARRAGRPYPNLVDNMAVARKKNAKGAKKSKGAKRSKGAKKSKGTKKKGAKKR